MLSIILIIVNIQINEGTLSIDLHKYSNCIFYPIFNIKKIFLSEQKSNIAPDFGGRVLLRRKDFENYFQNEMRRLPMWAKNNCSIEHENEKFVIYSLYQFKKKPYFLLSIDYIDHTILENVMMIQEVDHNHYIMRGGEVLNGLLKKYIKDNYIIPYDIEERKKLYPEAFEELKEFME